VLGGDVGVTTFRRLYELTADRGGYVTAEAFAAISNYAQQYS
jgi:hypothetical protein